MTIRSAQLVLPAGPLAQTLAFFCDRLEFRIESISPAEAPSVAVISGHGLRLRLDGGHAGDPGTLRLTCSEPGAIADGELALWAPNGTRIELVGPAPELGLPPLRPSLTIARLGEGEWTEGRAGMRYRDLIPDRQGGRFLASHIRIDEGGPVPDYVHYHEIRLQLIYCYKGWVRVVYEDQGPGFVLRPGDCVLQPPRIRHRVLESSAGLEVIEISSPAEHETLADHELELPTPTINRKREYEGQRFVHHEQATAPWGPWRLPGFEARELGVFAATGGLARARVARRLGPAPPQPCAHEGELLFLFVLAGGLTLRCDGRRAEPLEAGDCFAIPPGLWHELDQASEDVELLELCLPGDIPLS